jgi:hypothetical protein
MTFPVGGFPTIAQIVEYSHVEKPAVSVAFTGGVADLDLTDPTNGLHPCATDFYCGATGNLVAQLAGDTTTRTYPVTAGQIVTGLFILIKSTSVSGIVRR